MHSSGASRPGSASRAGRRCSGPWARIDGTVKCWGGDDGKRLGDATLASSATPVRVKDVTAVVRVRALLEVARTSAPAALTATFAAAAAK